METITLRMWRLGFPENGTWCWVSDGVSVWLAMRDESCAGGWTNCDTWENFERKRLTYLPLEPPSPPINYNL